MPRHLPLAALLMAAAGGTLTFGFRGGQVSVVALVATLALAVQPHAHEEGEPH